MTPGLSNHSENFQHVETLMQQGLADGVFPGAVLLVADRDTVLFHRAYGFAELSTRRIMTLDTVFDLASLTKPLATTLAVMMLVDQKKLKLDQSIGSILTPFSRTDRSRITVRHLLAHRSGLPDYRPYYVALSKLPVEDRPSARRDLLAKEPLVHPVGEKTLYSDLGFMILAWIVETVSGSRLDRFVARTVYQPLGIDRLFFIDLHASPPKEKFAATERCPRRRILLEGMVHDDNAYAMGGIDGHAGLFGTSEAVFRLIRSLLSAYFDRHSSTIFKKALVKTFFDRHQGVERPLGFDAPSPEGSASGHYFSSRSVGHLGFTGTSFWVDLARERVIILLTNRVHPTRHNTGIRVFRPALHDAVMARLDGPACPAPAS